jgi:hypothetical protein
MIIVTVHQDGRGWRTTTVEDWPRETFFDDSIFGQTDPAQLSLRGDLVTITVSNGQAVYQLLPGASDGWYGRLALPARLVSSRLTPVQTEEQR